MKYDALFFDLDGTLTESGPGIIKATIRAYEEMKLPVPDMPALRRFVGPPLGDSFLANGVSREREQEAIDIYRKYYNTDGWKENSVYVGIEDVLKKLQQAGMPMYVATSKPQKIAEQVIDLFHLTPYFRIIAGSDPSKNNEAKVGIIRHLMKEIPEKHPLLIGDTVFDARGARLAGLDCLGVSWGYGSPEEMVQEGAIGIADTPEELYETVLPLVTG